MRRRDFLLTPVAALSGAAARAQQAQRTLRVAFPSAETGFDPAQVQDLYSRTLWIDVDPALRFARES